MNSFCGIADIRGDGISFDILRKMGKEMIQRSNTASEAYLERHFGVLCVRDNATRESPQPIYAVTEQGIIALTTNGDIQSFGGIYDVGCLGTDPLNTLLQTYLALGYDCPQELDGRFAFALFDSSKKELFLVTDQLSASPIFLFQDDHKIVFSNKIKPLLSYSASCAEVDKKAILELIRSPDGEIKETDLYKNISELPAGHFQISSGIGNQLFEYASKIKTLSTQKISAQSCEITLSPNKSADPVSSAEAVLFALDYPQFDKYTPEYISAIRTVSTNNNSKDSFTLLTPPTTQSESYLQRKAHKLGEFYGVTLRLRHDENGITLKRSLLSDREKKLSAVAGSILNSDSSHIRRFFGNSLETIVSKEADLSIRIAMLGKIIGLERWLESYQIIPI